MPAPFNGMTFADTTSQGGYGFPSSEIYNLGPGGYKPFGAMGQGQAVNSNVDFNPSNTLRTMIMTILPGEGFNQGDRIIKFEVGSYPWNSTIDFTVPRVPNIYGYSSDNDRMNMAN